jgi:hypothetical protein
VRLKSKYVIPVTLLVTLLAVTILIALRSEVVDTYEMRDRQMIRFLSETLDRYKKDTGNYPLRLSVLVPSYMKKLPLDACYREFVYIYPGMRNKNKFDLSAGECVDKHHGVSN